MGEVQQSVFLLSCAHPKCSHWTAVLIVEKSCVHPFTFSYLFHPGGLWPAFGKQLAEVSPEMCKEPVCPPVVWSLCPQIY